MCSEDPGQTLAADRGGTGTGECFERERESEECFESSDEGALDLHERCRHVFPIERCH